MFTTLDKAKTDTGNIWGLNFDLDRREYGCRDSSHCTLYPQQFGTNFADKRQSLGQYSLLAVSGRGVYIYIYMVKDWNTRLLIVNVLIDKWLDWDLQRTDPASRQTGHLTKTGQQILDQNPWIGSNIWSKVHKVGSTPRHTDWMTVSRKMWLWLWTCPFSQIGGQEIRTSDKNLGLLIHTKEK
jgi:hypothetical protein